MQEDLVLEKELRVLSLDEHEAENESETLSCLENLSLQSALSVTHFLQGPTPTPIPTKPHL